MKIRFLGQSGYLIETDHSKILIDPYFSDSVNRIANRPRLLPIPINPCEIFVDAVVCTHDHLDHLDPDTVSQINDNQLFITTHAGKEKLLSLGKKNIVALSEKESIRIGDINLQTVFANHTTEAFGIILNAEDLTLYFSGDTLFDTKLFDIKHFFPNITFICINGRLGNMNVEEALSVAREIGAQINVPNHYDMFASNSENPHLFSDNIEGGTILEFNKTYYIDRDTKTLKNTL